ncbi:hypothetical protein HDU83_009012 [Entophlyctis luteolus]|nr:hypothetical protein HDU83_009012 [Entophlyctis luteolus]
MHRERFAYCRVESTEETDCLRKNQNPVRCFHLPKLHSRALIDKLKIADDYLQNEGSSKFLEMINNRICEAKVAADLSARLQLMDKAFNLIISRLTSCQPILAEIKREYDLVLSATSVHSCEKTFLRQKIQKLICEIGTPEILESELSKVYRLSFSLKAVQHVNEIMKQRHNEYDTLLVQYIGDLFEKEIEGSEGDDAFPLMTYEEKQMNENLELNSKAKERNLPEPSSVDPIGKDLGIRYKDGVLSDPFSSEERENEGSIEKEELKSSIKLQQHQLENLIGKISSYEEELKILSKPDGSQLVVGAGSEVLVYDMPEGELLQSLKAHKDNVYAVDYSADGSRFATGGADKQVIIWSCNLEGILKYSHSDTIQSLSHNPVTGHVLSCSSSDFGIWSPKQKNVQKHKVPARILSSSWTPDGQSFALGLFNGHVSIRDRYGEEKVRIERGNAPVWSLQWCPSADKDFDLLAVTDWNQKLAFFHINGRQVGKERSLGYDPTCVSFFSSGDYVVVGGSDHKATLWTAEGIKLGLVCESDSWVWCCKVKPSQNYVAVGCNDGSISVHQIMFNTVHGLYNDRYAFRENMTDVVIQHLVTEQRARIKCRDYVKKIAIFRDRLAVQLSDRIIIYELFHDDATDMHYRIKEKIQKKLDCNLLVFNGDKEREWNLESLIRYIKTIGGPRGQEGLLVGMKNGQIFQIFVNNPFPIPLIKQKTAIRCLDLNSSRTKLAVVDDQNMCLVYCLKRKELLFQEPDANSVSWNSELDDMLCFSGNGTLNVKTGNFLSHTQKMQGFVVGFKGSRIYCLHVYSMTTVDVPQSITLERYLDKKEFESGYKVACLGVTESDWRRLALDSLEGLNFEVAKKAFIRLRDVQFLDLLHLIDRMKNEARYEMDNVVGEINSYVGKFHEAARLFRRAGNYSRAIQMYTDLNMWEYATQLAAECNMDPVDILKRKAQTQQDRNDLIAAANTYIEVGDYVHAINIIGPTGAVDRLIEISRKLGKNDSKALNRCLFYFKKFNHHAYAAECLMKMGDISQLLALHVELMQWEEAFKIVETYPEFTQQIYLPYANWLATNDRYMEAQANYRKAGRIDEAMRVLEKLAKNSVTEWRFNDAAYYYHLLSIEYLQLVPDNLLPNKLEEKHIDALSMFGIHRATSEIYFAYHSVRKFVDEPFTSHVSESLLNMATFLLNYTMTHPTPTGISKVHILFALTKLAKSMGAYKLSRYGYERLQNYKIKPEWEHTTDIASLTIRGKPSEDREDILPLCFNCSTVNPMLNAKGDTCIQCKEKFIRSMYSFQILPLSEFVLAEGISDAEAQALINKEPLCLDESKNRRRTRKSESSAEISNQISRIDRSGNLLIMGREELSELRGKDGVTS